MCSGVRRGGGWCKVGVGVLVQRPCKGCVCTSVCQCKGHAGGGGVHGGCWCKAWGECALVQGLCRGWGCARVCSGARHRVGVVGAKAMQGVCVHQCVLVRGAG